MPPMVAEIKFVEPIFAAGQGEDDAVLRHRFGKFGVIIASRLCAVAAADEEEVLDRAALDCVNHFVGDAQHGIVAKAHQDGLIRAVVGEAGRGQSGPG